MMDPLNHKERQAASTMYWAATTEGVSVDYAMELVASHDPALFTPKVLAEFIAAYTRYYDSAQRPEVLGPVGRPIWRAMCDPVTPAVTSDRIDWINRVVATASEEGGRH